MPELARPPIRMGVARMPGHLPIRATANQTTAARTAKHQAAAVLHHDNQPQ